MSEQKTVPVWKKMIPGFIRKDFVRKIIALFLASIIYVAVLDRLSTSREIPGIHIPLKAPAGFVLIEKGSPAVRLSVTGSQSKLKELKPEDFTFSEIEIKPENYEEGKSYTLPLSPSNFHGPLGVTVVSVSPESLQVHIDKLVTKDLKVKAEYDTTFPLPHGYVVKGTTVTPELVRVTAPSMVMRNLEDIKTLPVELNTMTQDFDIDKNILVPYDGMKVSPQSVVVRTKIERKFEEKTFSDLKINIMQDSNWRFELPSVEYADVTLSAPLEILQKLTSENIKVYAFVGKNIKSGSHTLKLQCNVNTPGVTVLKISPETVKVTLK